MNETERRRVATALREWERDVLFIIFLYLPFQWFLHATSIVRSYKIGSIETENIDPYKSALTAARSFPLWVASCSLKRGSEGNDTRLWLYFNFYENGRGFFTRKPQIWFAIVLPPNSNTKTLFEWGRCAWSYKSFRENASLKWNQKLRRFNKNVNSWECRSSFPNFTHEPSQHPFPQDVIKIKGKILAKCWFQ